jgi:transposase InsO family protein
VYLTVALDLYDRNVIGWVFSTDLETSHTVIPDVDMAVNQRSAQAGLIFHADRAYGMVRKVSVRRRTTGVRPSGRAG